jgi:hypothetical protein
MDRLCTEAIQHGPFESVDDIESGDSFPLSVFGVSDGITNDLEEDEYCKDSETANTNVTHSQGIS